MFFILKNLILVLIVMSLHKAGMGWQKLTMIVVGYIGLFVILPTVWKVSADQFTKRVVKKGVSRTADALFGKEEPKDK